MNLSPYQTQQSRAGIAAIMFIMFLISLPVYLLKQTQAAHLHNHDTRFVIWVEAWQSLNTNHTSQLKTLQDHKRERFPLFVKLCLAN